MSESEIPSRLTPHPLPSEAVTVGLALPGGERCPHCNAKVWPAAAFAAHVAGHGATRVDHGRRCVECNRPVGLNKIGGRCARCEVKQSRRQRASVRGRLAAGKKRKTRRVKEKLEGIPLRPGARK